MDFYLSLQNPKTGAFMDDSYPFCTYTGPTGNVLNHLDALAAETGRPIKLKYPLKYLDEINTTAKLKAYLDDVSTVGSIGLKFPQTTFHFARCLLSLFHEDSVVEKHGLYPVTPEWKKALLKWFYDNQDPATGLWGPKSKDGKLVKKDTMNTASIMKAFVDKDGNDLHKDFPLRYKNEMANSYLAESLNELPDDDDLDDWHEWNLNTSKSIRTFNRYLWNGLSDETKSKVLKLTEKYIRIKFQKFYVKDEGAFAYYPGSEHATLDGTSGMLGTFKDLGYFSEIKHQQIWGDSVLNCKDLGVINTVEITPTDLNNFTNSPEINSIRYYIDKPEEKIYTANVIGVYYPKETSVLDIMDFVPKMKSWINSTEQSMGNWTSNEDIKLSLSGIDIKTVPVSKESVPIKELNEALKINKNIVVVGFDVLQQPIRKITYNVSGD